MTLHVCSVPDCGALTTRGRCAIHRTEARRARGNPPDNGHRNTRTHLLPDAINTPCPMCRQPMHQDQPLQLDHTTPRAHGNNGPGDRIVHATCNASAGGKLGHTIRES